MRLLANRSSARARRSAAGATEHGDTPPGSTLPEPSGFFRRDRGLSRVLCAAHAGHAGRDHRSLSVGHRTGWVFEIQRFAIHVGSGIRTTVFLKHCPLRSRRCSNPESVTLEPLLSADAARCRGCGECVRACPTLALRMPEGGGAAVHERGCCTVCRACAPVGAPAGLEVVGRDITVADLIEILLCDRWSRAVGCPRAAHAAHGRLVVRRKETDAACHREFAGESNEIMLENRQRLHNADAANVMRCPIIPGHNARDEHLDGIARLAARLPRLPGIERLPYFDLWCTNCRALDAPPPFPPTFARGSRNAEGLDRAAALAPRAGGGLRRGLRRIPSRRCTSGARVGAEVEPDVETRRVKVERLVHDVRPAVAVHVGEASLVESDAVREHDG